MPPGEWPPDGNFQQMKARNQALAWLCLCYPAMPPAFVCGIEVATGHPVYWIGLGLFYTLLLYALGRCLRDTGFARWAFGLALGATLVHLLAVLMVFWPGRGDWESTTIGSIFAVSTLVGLGGAQLAWIQGRGWLTAGLLATCASVMAAGGHYQGPLDNPQLFLVSFFVQALLLWRCRQSEAEEIAGTGFIPSQR